MYYTVTILFLLLFIHKYRFLFSLPLLKVLDVEMSFDSTPTTHCWKHIYRLFHIQKRPGLHNVEHRAHPSSVFSIHISHMKHHHKIARAHEFMTTKCLVLVFSIHTARNTRTRNNALHRAHFRTRPHVHYIVLRTTADVKNQQRHHQQQQQARDKRVTRPNQC